MKALGNISEFIHKLAMVDLQAIKYSLVHREDGVRWTLSKADETEKWYRRFLLLNFIYPEERIVPTRDIDVFWHTHILDTYKYIEDCKILFGEYLHHFPYFGERGVDDKNKMQTAFLNTLALFELNFNEIPIARSTDRESAACGVYIDSMHGKAGYDETVRPAISLTSG